jgi:DNA-binding CsgD family transcriptional regulator
MLQQADFRACLDAVHAIASAGAGVDDFARAGAANLKRLVSAELTTLSICALDDGRRRVVADIPGAISRRDIAAFDRHFDAHPLVRDHGRNPAAMGIDHAMAVPIHVDREELVSFVFNRRGRDFDDRERDLLELIRPHLGDLYRITRAVDDARAAWGVPSARCALERLTGREREVLRWLAGGKTDRDIADILGISPRTVNKHLQRIYEKLGVETRTAAVVRALELPRPN